MGVVCRATSPGVGAVLWGPVLHKPAPRLFDFPILVLQGWVQNRALCAQGVHSAPQLHPQPLTPKEGTTHNAVLWAS